MGRRRDESGLTIKMLKTYVPEFHFNQGKEWTINDIQYILNSTSNSVCFLSFFSSLQIR